MRISKGRIVLFKPKAADKGIGCADNFVGIVTSVIDQDFEVVNLATLGESSLYFNHKCGPFDPAQPELGGWFWPTGAVADVVLSELAACPDEARHAAYDEWVDDPHRCD